jgi:hypothetical protein
VLKLFPVSFFFAARAVRVCSAVAALSAATAVQGLNLLLFEQGTGVQQVSGRTLLRRMPLLCILMCMQVHMAFVHALQSGCWEIAVWLWPIEVKEQGFEHGTQCQHQPCVIVVRLLWLCWLALAAAVVVPVHAR